MDGVDDKQISKKSSLSILLSGNNGTTQEKTANEDIWYDASIPTGHNAVDSRRDVKSEPQESSDAQNSKISAKDLILAIYENELCGGDCEEEKPVIDADVPVLEQFRLLAAEEDGTPMDDLPEFSSNTDVLAMGIEDFVLVSKKSSEKLVHVRITQGGDRSLTKIKNGSTFPVMQYSECEAELSKHPSLGFLEMYRQDSDVSITDESITSPRNNSLENSGYEAPKMFRTQSEDELFGLGSGIAESSINPNRSSVDNLSSSVNSTELRMSDYKSSFEATSSYSTADTLRKRSWSENLIISCRRPGTDHWSSPRNIVVGVAGSQNRKRANTGGVTQIVKTPQRPIPAANGQVESEKGPVGKSLSAQHNGGGAHNTTNGKSMKYFIDTGIDPLKQYQSDQEILHLRSSSSSLPSEDILLSLNPHTSSSKLVLTPTNASSVNGGASVNGNSRPSSAAAAHVGSITPISGIGSSSGQKLAAGLPPTVPSTTNSKTSATGNNVLTSKELAAYFNERATLERQYSSDLSDEEEEDSGRRLEGGRGASADEYDSGNENMFSFVDSPEAQQMYSKSKDGSSREDVSVDSTAKGGSSVNEEEVRQYSSGSDYSASDYEALHRINRDMAEFHLRNNAFSTAGSSSSSGRLRSSSENPKHLSFNGTASAKMALTAAEAEGRRRTSSETPATEAVRRPSWFQQLVGLVSGPISPVKSAKSSPMHRDSSTSRTSFSIAMAGPAVTEEQEEEDEDEAECSFVKDLSTGEVISLDEDGDGAVTAVLITPDLIYGGPPR